MPVREIFTKAVIAKGNIESTESYKIQVDDYVASVLGCWIVNHKYSANIKDGKVHLNGSFDVNLWYASKEDSSDVFLEKKEYEEEFTITYMEADSLLESHNVSVTCLLQPHCSKANVISEHTVEIVVEKQFKCDVLGEVFLNIETIVNTDEVTAVDFVINQNFIKE